MKLPFSALAIYCGSATPADPRYIELAGAVGAALAQDGIAVVYGGGRLGLMGALADGALAAGGKVVGVIPDRLVSAEVAHMNLTELHTVRSMHERKALFADLSDGFITLPGGVGTMDELWEALSWAQLGYHAKPVGLLNAFGYYDALLAFNRQMAEVGFVRPVHADLLQVDNNIKGLLGKMAAAPPANAIFDLKAEQL